MASPNSKLNHLFNLSRINILFFNIIFIFFIFIGLSNNAWGESKKAQTQSPPESKNIFFSQWLMLGPHHYPIGSLLNSTTNNTLENIFAIEATFLPTINPEEGKVFNWYDGSSSSWKTISVANEEAVIDTMPKESQICYLANYLDARRWVYAELHLASHHLFQVFLDGKLLFSKGPKQVANKAQMSIPISLTPGKHLLLIKTISLPEEEKKWSIKGFLSVQPPYTNPLPEVSISPEQRLSLHHLLNSPQVSELALSSNGKRAALLMRQIDPVTNTYRSWIEIYDLTTKNLILTISPENPASQIKWSSDNSSLAYLTQKKSGANLWVIDLNRGKSQVLLKNIENFHSYFWFPDGESILYITFKKEKPAQEGLIRYRHLADREPDSRQKLSFFRFHLKNKDQHPLLLDEIATSVEAISPDGNKLLLAQTVIKETERPFSETRLITLDLSSLEREVIWQGKWFNRSLWSPNSNQLLILGGPSLAGSLGKNLPSGLIPNEYDTQAYLFDLASKKFQALTKDFDPAINEAFWSPVDEHIYLVATDKSYRHFFRLDLKRKKITHLDLPVEVIEAISFASQEMKALVLGSSVTTPQKIYEVNLATGESSLLAFPGKEVFKHVRLGKVENWSFTNNRGRKVPGRIYYPPDFDPTKKYPCLIYYYGGTFPTTREFGGRYPKNLYAAHGYVIYVLQPSGAVGYGQEISALHVNDWGQIVGDEIISGVKKFLATHPFIDSTRVGCLGASYGGFMTMYILTKTNIFAAAMAHAGISLIPSYWGQGYWGYSYSAIATANSYPWNRRDIYVDQSPLFMADKITTPLLLLHGSEDTNVPPGESTQMFTSLRILGREAEYIQVLGQNHHILSYKPRLLWTQTILAWFDKWLKKQPEWWNHLYPPR